jgi:NADH:ubiquinone oxidoreductase subunit 6 (subunit J)
VTALIAAVTRSMMGFPLIDALGVILAALVVVGIMLSVVAMVDWLSESRSSR